MSPANSDSPETPTVLRLRETLRAAKTIDDARRVAANVPPEALVRLVADQGRLAERPEVVGRARRVRLGLSHAALAGTVLGFGILMLADAGRISRDARNTALYAVYGAQIVIALINLATPSRPTHRLRLGKFALPLLTDAVKSLNDVPSLSDLMIAARLGTTLLGVHFLETPAETARKRAFHSAARDALLRLLPRVTPTDADGFLVEELESFRRLVVRPAKRTEDPTAGDADMAVAGWLALSALVGADAMTPKLRETLLADAARVVEFGHFAHVRAAAGEFQEAVRAKPPIQKLSPTTDEPTQQQRLG